jgi:hypothetical protein
MFKSIFFLENMSDKLKRLLCGDRMMVSFRTSYVLIAYFLKFLCTICFALVLTLVPVIVSLLLGNAIN